MPYQHQLAIIGGGMQGAALFWEAVHRGIDTMLIERDDYGAGTSANSLRVVHGGLRHLQRADVGSCLQMIREQRVLMRIAPALVRPLPCAMPTSRSGKRSAPVMRAGLWLYDRLREVEALAARSQVALPASGLRDARGSAIDSDLQAPVTTALACWHDAQALHAERLTLAFVNAGRRHGGEARNHTEVRDCRRQGSGFALQLQDRLDGDSSTLHCQQVIDCSSDWRFHRQQQPPHPGRLYIKAVNLLLDQPPPALARGLYVSNEHVDSRLLFLTPWRGHLLVGTWYFPVHDRRDGRAALTPAELAICQRDLDSLLAQPAGIVHAQVGYLPATDDRNGTDPANDLLKNGRSFCLAEGLEVVEATKFTTVRALACRTIDRLASGGELRAGASASRHMLLTQPFDDALFSSERLGCYERLLRGAEDGLPAAVLADADHAIDNEQVVRLADLVRRRLPLGDVRPPPAAVTEALLSHLTARRGWSAQRQQQERLALAAEYPLTDPSHE